MTRVIVRDSDGLTYVHLNNTGTPRPTCAQGTTYWMIPDENSEAGKKLYSLLLTAKVMGSPVRVVGKNNCIRWSDGEDIAFVVMN